MKPRFRKKMVPPLNTTSTSDISFMLLIFFLVTTSMDMDKGLSRQLPPMVPHEELHSSDVKEGTVLRLDIVADNSLMCDGRTMAVSRLRPLVENFVKRVGKEHIIQLQADRHSSYDAYFRIQNEIVAAYNRLRDERARKVYRRPFKECTAQEQKRLREEIPQRIAEIYSSEEGGAR